MCINKDASLDRCFSITDLVKMKTLILLVFLATFQAITEAGPIKKGPKVIIVGAGAAGIAAASRLLSNGFEDVVLLEAKDVIGGRIQSVRFGESLIELGAEHCHGEDGNVVYELVQDLNILKEDPADPKYLYPNNENIDPDLQDRLLQLYEDIFFDEDRNGNQSLGAYVLTKYLEGISDDYNEEEKVVAIDLLDVFRKLGIEEEGSFSWFQPAADSDYAWCEGLQTWNWNGYGYKTVLDLLLSNVDQNKLISFNKPAVAIDWNDGGVVTCADGTIHQADHVIVTMSLGVLKAQHLELFSPPLPSTKVGAIERLQIDAVTKIFFHFPAGWWPDTFSGIEFVWHKDAIERSRSLVKGPGKDGKLWIHDILGLYPIQRNPNVLKMWLVGKFVPEIELSSEETVVDGLMYMLETFMGHYNFTRPDKMIRYNWYVDPYFRGSYSYQAVHTHKGDDSDEVELSLPLYSNSGKPTLLFAGEATHPIYYSAVHGAIESGFREADRLISFYR